MITTDQISYDSLLCGGFTPQEIWKIAIDKAYAEEAAASAKGLICGIETSHLSPVGQSAPGMVEIEWFKVHHP